MRCVLSRVREARAEVGADVVGYIHEGLLVLAGIEKGDCQEDIEFIAKKTLCLRIFEDTGGKMNKSIMDTGGEILVVPQFTLLANARKGTRPGYSHAEDPELAEKGIEKYTALLRDSGIHVESGRFRTEMLVTMKNYGPVTILLDSRRNLNA